MLACEKILSAGFCGEMCPRDPLKIPTSNKALTSFVRGGMRLSEGVGRSG